MLGMRACSLLALAAAVVAYNPLDYVNLFIGTINGGHTFPGATVPHGMVKVGMDTDSPGNHAGYDGNSTFNVTGFSPLHQEGTGGGIPLSQFKLFPLLNCTVFDRCLTDLPSRKILRRVLDDGSPDDAASPGYFSTNLSNSIRVELTSTRRAALERFTFPESSVLPRMVLDITSDGRNTATRPFASFDPETGRIKAGANYASSFGPGRYDAFTCVDFHTENYESAGPIEYGSYLGLSPDLGGTELSRQYIGFGPEHGFLVGFPSAGPEQSSSILARVGVSFVSTDQACASAEEEIPDWDFERVRQDSRAQWGDILGRVQVGTDGANETTIELLYSSLYRTHLIPSDHTGENSKWQSNEPYWDDFYCNWDTYRTMFSLMAMHDPVTYSKIVRGLIDIQKNEGYLPEGREAGQLLHIQGGSHGDPILAELFVKYQQFVEYLGINAQDLYTALLTDAEDQPLNWNIQGRQADIWKELSYIPSNTNFTGGANTKQVSRTLEYAFDDFTISQVAKAMGNVKDGQKYASRAGNFVNVWNPNTTVPDDDNGIVGFMQPRFANGTFNYTDPRHCSVHSPDPTTCFLNAIRRDGFYETSPIVYSQYVPQDTARLIELQGGADQFVKRLDWIFDNEYFDFTNEPSQQIPFMYHYANRPGKSTERSRETIDRFFNTSINGLPGNDDGGAMGSYVVFYLAGMYPLPATRQILISSPYFPSISFSNPLTNGTTTIVSNNFGGDNVYVQNVTINGKPWKSSCFVEWDVFLNSSTVVLELTDNPDVSCGDGDNALPPSLSTGGYD